ncbi:MAG: HpaII family restriction endonuclease [Candidatus Moranbacteria bacterium]|nr:HpaII family restriction endonuclease [Candidatus Moranbacteria bacterium]MDD3965076.1 HpaII family restriction endonuclease [Candidatus Moranbacteria bacterium]
MIKGNKGEWSEFYAFLKILTDGKMFTADKNLEILKDNFHIVLKIIREETESRKSYDISKQDGNVVIRDEKSEFCNIVEINKIKSKVAEIFEEMKNSNGTTFQVLSAEGVMKDLRCIQIKASNIHKADLTIVLHDKKSPEFPELGFSIKSMLGSPSTLLNASGATNFTYKVVESFSEASSENNISAVREKSKHVYDAGGHLEFVSMDNEGFRTNLRKVDSNFPQMIAEILKHYYKGKASKISDLVDSVSDDADFCKKLDLNKRDFAFKMKRFLSDVALGMTPKKEWDGYASAHGGYIIVKEDGDVVCYHIYNRDKFEDYLYDNTKLDTPSTTRHKFGDFYTENGEKRIKYNLQIRFVK